MQKTGIINEGKTKKVCSTDIEGVVILENKTDITANDDPSVTRQFSAKAVAATTTTCNVFRLLQDAGLPVAHSRVLSHQNG